MDFQNAMEIHTLIGLATLVAITQMVKAPLAELQQKMTEATKAKWNTVTGNH